MNNSVVTLLITYNSHLESCFLLIDWLSFEEEEGDRSELDAQRQGNGRILDEDGQGVGTGKSDNFHGRHICIVPFDSQKAQNQGAAVSSFGFLMLLGGKESDK